MNDRKPCPFCGFKDTSAFIDEKGSWGRIAVVSCETCGASVWGIGVMVPEDGGPDEELIKSAVEAWNTRTEPRA